VFLTGMFTYLWVARRGLHPAACVFAGATLMLSAPHLMHIRAGHLSNLCAMPWVPATFLAVDGMCDRRGTGWTLFGIAALACLLLAGHPQYALYTALAVAVYVALRARKIEGRGAVFARLVVVGVGAGLVAAVQLWTTAREAAYTLRAGGVPWEFASMFSFPPENLSTLIAPGFFGAAGDAYWGRAHLWEVHAFFGVTGLVLAVRGALDPDRERLRFSGTMVVVLLLLALGANTPLYRGLYELVPGFDRFRSASRLGYFAAMFAAMLAGIGAHRLCAGGKPGWRGIAAVAAGALIVAGAALGVATTEGATFGGWMKDVRAAGAQLDEAFLDPAAYDDPEFVSAARDRAARALGYGAGTLAVIAGFLAAARAWRVTTVGLGLIGLVELLGFAWSLRVTCDPELPLFEALRSRVVPTLGSDRVFNTLALNSAMTTGAADIWGYEPAKLRRYAELVTFTQGGDPDSASRIVDFQSVSPLYAMLRLRAAIVQSGGRAQVVPVQAKPLPRWRFYDRFRVEDDRDAVLAAISSPDFDLASEVVLETTPDPPPAPGESGGTVRVTDESTDRVDFEVTVDRPSLLLMTDAYHPFWRAEGRPGSVSSQYEILPANWVLRAIPLPAGEHRIRLEYRVPGFRIAAVVSMIAAFAWLAGLLGWAVRRRAEVV
jgi:hypothetical protein